MRAYRMISIMRAHTHILASCKQYIYSLITIHIRYSFIWVIIYIFIHIYLVHGNICGHWFIRMYTSKPIRIIYKSDYFKYIYVQSSSAVRSKYLKCRPTRRRKKNCLVSHFFCFSTTMSVGRKFSSVNSKMDRC